MVIYEIEPNYYLVSNRYHWYEAVKGEGIAPCWGASADEYEECALSDGKEVSEADAPEWVQSLVSTLK